MNIFNYLNTHIWDKYKGKDFKICVIDNHLVNINKPDWEVELQKKWQHSYRVREVLNKDEILPLAEVTITAWATGLDTVLAGDFDMVIIVTGGSITTDIHNKIKEIYKRDIPIFVSTGNNSNITKLAQLRETLSITALHLEGDKLIQPDYANRGKGVFCSGLSNFFIDGKIREGTSYSCPLTGGMVGKWMQWYKETYNKKPRIRDIVTFMIVNCGGEVYNTNVGYGLFKLPTKIPARM